MYIKKGKKMTLSYKTLLIACIPLSLQSMEQQTPIQQNMLLIEQHGNDLNSLYKNGYTLLNNYNATNPETAIKLLDIINATNQLKNKNNSENLIGISEKHIGLYSFKQYKSPMFKPTSSPYNNAHYVSILFARIAEYNKHIEKNKFITPTLEQFTGHKNNVAIKSAVNIAADFRLYIDVLKISAEKDLFAVIPTNVALIEIENLIEDITKMLSVVPDTTKTLAEILYAEKIEFNTIKKL
jgi:hypothetical protein